MWRPSESIKVVEGEFHVSAQEDLPDLVVGKDKMADVTMAQEAGRSQEGLERLLHHQGLASNPPLFLFSLNLDTDSLAGRPHIWSRPAGLLTPQVTPPGRTGLSFDEGLTGPPFPLHAAPIPPMTKTSESVSGISDQFGPGTNRETTDPAHYPPRRKLFSENTRFAVQGTPTKIQPAIQEQSTQTEINARIFFWIGCLRTGIRATFCPITLVLAMILVIELFFCWHSIIYSSGQPLRLGLGMTWLRNSLLELPLQHIGFTLMHFMLLGILVIWRQWLFCGEAGGDRGWMGISL